jgi:hypothetical protein
MFALRMSKIIPLEAFQLNDKQKLYLLIALKIQKLGLNISPKILLHGDQHIQSAIALKKSSMLLGVHDGFAFAAAVLLHYGQRISTITSDPYIGNTLWRTGVRPDQVELITSDFRSLERVRASMARGVIPAICIDYPNETGIKKFISPKVFDFGIRRGISIFFVKSRIGDDGSVHIYMDALQSTLDPVADAELFIDFIMTKKFIILLFPVQCHIIFIGKQYTKTFWCCWDLCMNNNIFS